MNDMTPTREQREAKLEGMGCKRKRVEDIRFTQGKGNYVDDLKLPGMLHGDFVRSPHAHARVKSINSEEALKVPGVLAVITAETLKTVNLAWMPTLAGDVQMVLADGKVLFQNQEVAFVVATDRYAADDGINKVVVEYEPLPVVIDPFKAMDADAPVLREDLAGKTIGRAWPAPASQPRLRVDHRRQGPDRRRLQQGRGQDQGDDLLSPHPSVAAGDLPVRLLVRQDQGRAVDLGHFPGPACDPHRGGADRENSGTQDPRDLARHRRRLRQQGRRLSRLHLCGGGLDRDRQARQMGRGSHREPHRHLVRARLPHDHRDRRDQGGQGHRPARSCAGRSWRLRRLRRSVEMAGRLLQHRHRILRFPDRACGGRRHLHQQGAGRRRLSLLVPGDGGGLLHRARHGHSGAKARDGSGRTAAEEFHQAGAVPVSLGAGLGI